MASAAKRLPRISTVQHYFYKWRDSGLWRTINGALVKAMRQKQDASPLHRPDHRQPECKNHRKWRPRGFDMARGERSQAPHRHRYRRFVARSPVQTGNTQDNHGAVPCCRSSGRMFPTLRHMFADRVYQGPKLLAAIAIWANGPLKSSPVRRAWNVQGRTSTLGRRTDACLARPQPTARQRLRAPLPAPKPGS